MSLSAIVITKNAGKKLERCLASLRFCDEIVVVDSGSMDETIKIAEKHHTHVIQSKDTSYSENRNLGAKHAKGDWLLYIDADEVVTDILEKNIFERITNDDLRITNYRIFRKNIILGKWLKHGGWWPDPVHRLIKKSSLVRWEGALHEQPKVTGEIGEIREPIIHYSKDSVSEMVENSKLFAPIEARLLFESKHPPIRVYHVFLAMWGELWNRGILKSGWLDGPIGILEVFYQMFHKILVYGTLWEMQIKKQEIGNKKQ